MKKNTTQTPVMEQQQPSKMPMTDKVGIAFFLTGVLASAVIIAGPPLYKRFGPAPTVECNKCHHIVTKASAVAKKKFTYLYGGDDKFKILYFCNAHIPAWGYVVGDELFKPQPDLQCNEDGSVVSNIATHVSGWWFETDTNGVTKINREGTIETRTNFGGHGMAKHLDY